uniref:SFRICE_039869 n=1 Tax=Spodoptera frugiperda TaxID=7108 RepID=A0A2H1VCF6_SPOFR
MAALPSSQPICADAWLSHTRVPRMFSLASSSSTSSSGMPAVYRFITGGRHTDPPVNVNILCIN